MTRSLTTNGGGRTCIPQSTSSFRHLTFYVYFSSPSLDLCPVPQWPLLAILQGCLCLRPVRDSNDHISYPRDSGLMSLFDTELLLSFRWRLRSPRLRVNHPAPSPEPSRFPICRLLMSLCAHRHHLAWAGMMNPFPYGLAPEDAVQIMFPALLIVSSCLRPTGWQRGSPSLLESNRTTGSLTAWPRASGESYLQRPSNDSRMQLTKQR